MEQSMIKIASLNGGYPDNRVLNSVSLEIEKGSFTAIAGPNGCGKTTLLKHLIKELKTEDNSVFISGKDINSLKQNELAQKVSLVSQMTENSNSFTVAELVSLGRFCHGDISEENPVCIKAMELTGILNLKNRLITSLSGGEFQLAMLARAICQDTEILLLDEPTNNLDPSHQIKLMKLLRQLSDNGKTVICVMHDLNAVLNWCDDCILMKEGTIFANGKAKQVITEKNIEEVYNTKCEIISPDSCRYLLTFCCSL